ARHCLERRQPEAFVQAREDEAGGAVVELDQLVVGDAAARLDSLRRGSAIVIRPRQDESQLGSLAPDEGEGLDQPLVVLVRPAVCRIDQERLTRPPVWTK